MNRAPPRPAHGAGLVLAACWGLASAGEPQTAPPLAAREAAIRDRFLDLERSLLRLADLLDASDPRRAGVLREAFARARDAEVGDRLGLIVRLLEDGQLLKAGASQEDAISRLRDLLGHLEAAGGDQRVRDAKREVRDFVTRLTRLIARQRELEGATESGGDATDLAARQRTAADEARALGEAVEGFADRNVERPVGGDPPGEAESGPGTPEPAKRTRERLGESEARMRSAVERLEQARRSEARSEQEGAIAELESARAELEEILRQLREEEVEKLLVQLEARLRAMLRAEQGIRDAVARLATGDARGPRERQLEAARVGRDQAAVSADADRALALLRDDGSAVAIPQALTEVRDDARQVADRLARGDAGSLTLGIVDDLIGALAELLSAVEKSRSDEQGRRPPPAGGRAAEPAEQPLVDQLAELKMLRALQARVNDRTRRFGALLADGAEEAEEPERRAALERLAIRQRDIERAARGIVGGLVQ